MGESSKNPDRLLDPSAQDFIQFADAQAVISQAFKENRIFEWVSYGMAIILFVFGLILIWTIQPTVSKPLLSRKQANKNLENELQLTQQSLTSKTEASAFQRPRLSVAMLLQKLVGLLVADDLFLRCIPAQLAPHLL